MIEAASFHCKLHIMRPASDYGINNKLNSFKSLIKWFICGENIHFTVGGGDDYIRMKNLSARHISGDFSTQGLDFEAKNNIRVVAERLDREIMPGETLQLGINKLKSPFKMIFAEDTIIAGKLTDEEEKLSRGAYEYLQSKFGSLRKIQEGKSSLIYTTENNRVIKVLRPYYTRSKGVIGRFNSVARKLTTDDPASLEISDFEYYDKYALCYVVMKYFPGESLENYMGRCGIIPIYETKSIIKNLAASLYTFQNRGYVCRNLSPGNIFLCKDGSIRITGFFLAKTGSNITMPGAQMIIPKYTSPEQMKNPTDADILSDMFSLGAIFYNMLIGEAPFEAVSTKDYVKLILSQKSMGIKDIQKTAPHIPTDVCKIIASLLAFERKKRPTPETLISQLDNILSSSQEVSPYGDQNESIEDPFSQDPFSEDILDKIDAVCDTETEQQQEEQEKVWAIPISENVEEEFSDDFLDILDRFSNETKEYCLEVIESESTELESRRWTFTDNEQITIGRKSDCSIQGDARISREHARIEIVGEDYWLVDLQSGNGTFLEEERITREMITNGTEFRVGKTLMRFSVIEFEPSIEKDISEIMHYDLTQSTLTDTSEALLNTKIEQEKSDIRVKKFTRETEGMPVMPESNQGIMGWLGQTTLYLKLQKHLEEYKELEREQQLQIAIGAVVTCIVFLILFSWVLG